MGVISFYRGNLHKVPDTPRRWPIPKPSITLQDFKILLERRNRALQRLQNVQQPQHQLQHSEEAENENENENENEEAEGMGDNGCTKDEQKSPSLFVAKIGEENKRKREELEESERDRELKRPKREREKEENAIVAVEIPMECEPVVGAASKDKDDAKDSTHLSQKSGGEEMDVDLDSSHKSKHKEEPPQQGDKISKVDKSAQQVHKNPGEIANKLKKKHELESKLKVLTEEKHHLVQMLKHILSTEEEMKKRSQIVVQTPAMNVPLPFQGEATVDVGSHTRQAGRRIGTELNCYGDLEEGELEDACTPNPHVQNLHHVHGLTGSSGSVNVRLPNSSQQPCQTSQQMKTGVTAAYHSQHNTTSSSGLITSPSLLGVHGSHGSHIQHANIPQLTVPAAQIGVCSPSPATSSGTSIFRDTRRTSPSWNQR